MTVYTYKTKYGTVDIADYGVWGIETSTGRQYDTMEDAMAFEGVTEGPLREEVYPD